MSADPAMDRDAEMHGQPHGPDAPPIVERLLDARYIGQEGMRAEAADEITRLRSELAEAQKALEEALHWHQRQDKALSKSARKDADYHWRRGQHLEQIEALTAALQPKEDSNAE